MFRAYAFLPMAVQSTTPRVQAKKKKSTTATVVWQVVAIATSTPFTISAYRKPATENEIDLSSETAPSHLPTQDASVNDTSLSDDESHHEQHVALSSEKFVQTLWETRNPSVVKATSNLAILGLFLTQIQPTWLSPLTISQSLFPLLRFWRSSAPLRSGDHHLEGADTSRDTHHHHDPTDNQERLLVHFINYCAPQVVSMMTPASAEHQLGSVPFSSHEEHAATVAAEREKLSHLAEQSFDLLCELLENGRWSHIESFLWSCHSSSLDENLAEKEGSEAVYSQFVEMVVDQINSVLLTKHATTLNQLADEIVSSVFVDRKKGSDDDDRNCFAPFVHEQIDALLRNTSMLGITHFDEQLRLVVEHERDVIDPTTSMGLLTPGDFNGRWVCRSVETRCIQGDMRSTESNFHATSVLFALLHMFGFDLEILGEQSGEIEDDRLVIHSLVSFFPEVGSEFVLDGKFHPCDVLPSGLSVAWFMSHQCSAAADKSPTWCIEYRGQILPSSEADGDANGEIVVDAYQYSSAGTGLWVHLVFKHVRFQHPLHHPQQHRRQAFQSIRHHKRRTSSLLATKTRLRVQVTLSTGRATRDDSDFEFTHPEISPQQRYERIQTWEEQFTCTATYDRHFPTLSTMTRATAAVVAAEDATMSREVSLDRGSEGESDELSAIV